jgi:hypothetical protein
MLVAVAQSAYNEMTLILDSDSIPPYKRPSVMTALVAGNEIFISSSIRRNEPGFSTTFSNSPATTLLKRCVITDPDRGASQRTNQTTGNDHRTGGNCGEPAAVHLYYKRHMITAATDMPPNSRVVTVIRDPNNNLIVIPPCAMRDNLVAGQQWGCGRFLGETNIRSINRDIPATAIPQDLVVRPFSICI